MQVFVVHKNHFKSCSSDYRTVFHYAPAHFKSFGPESMAVFLDHGPGNTESRLCCQDLWMPQNSPDSIKWFDDIILCVCRNIQSGCNFTLRDIIQINCGIFCRQFYTKRWTIFASETFCLSKTLLFLPNHFTSPRFVLVPLSFPAFCFDHVPIFLNPSNSKWTKIFSNLYPYVFYILLWIKYGFVRFAHHCTLFFSNFFLHFTQHWSCFWKWGCTSRYYRHF